ncbi:MAG TPA: hypothetical protein VF621_11405 [Pyrinomonadaceae bacterium]
MALRWKGRAVRAAAGLALAWLLAGACSCAPPAGAGGRALGFTLSNFTGSTLRAIHISPSDSAGWEEDILGGEVLHDGGAIVVRFGPEENVTLWDLRVETTRRRAEWKRLDLRDASTVTLYLSQDGERPWVAEIE